MRPKFTLPYFEEDLESLLNKDLTIEEFLDYLFNDEEDVSYTEMCGRLIGYHDTEGGAPEVTDFEILEAEFDDTTLTGSFDTEFTAHFNYGCDDYNKEKDDTITWDFKIDKENLVVEFTGEEPWRTDSEGY